MIDNYDFWNLDPEKYWSPPKENTRLLAKQLIYSGEYIGSLKRDGHWFMFGKEMNGTMWLRSRTKSTVTKDYSDKIEWVPHIKEEMKCIPNGTVFLGEIYFPGNEGSKNVTTIMGCLQKKAMERQIKGDKLHYYIFDILAFNGKCLMNYPLVERISNTGLLIEESLKQVYSKYVHTTTYYEGEQLWKYVIWALSNGYEGVVIQRKDSKYTPGKRTARKSLKIKKEIEIEIDAYLTGRIKPATMEYKGKEPETWNYWIDVRTEKFLEGVENYDTYLRNGMVVPITKDYFYGLPGSIEFGVMDKDGKDVSLCWISNITDDIKWAIKESESNLRGKIAKITAMEVDNESGALRHSKITEWRADGDKNFSQCTQDQVLK